MVIIKKIGVLSLAKIQAIIMAITGLIAGIFIAAFGGSMFAQAGFGTIGAGLGILAIVVVPIIYAVLGFVSGAVGAIIYNKAADFIGGIEIEFDK